MKKQHLTSLYLEALLLVVSFVAAILVLTGVFGASRVKSAEARQLTQAVTLAANAAEAASAADDLEQAAAILDQGGNVRRGDGLIEAAYFSDGSPCTDGRGALRMTVAWEPSPEDPSLVECRIAVYAADKETPVYTLETARWGKEAAP